jgi:2-polyprenyl-6-methoxyphenol hydroxylase-like FAD-dependent oxidoreductase
VYDVIIVGARCAGSATAMLLARGGHRVLLVDRATFPSDTLSTHWIHQPGVAKLRDWGLLDAVRGSGCPPITQLTFDVGPFALRGSPVAAGDVAAALAPRRTILDAILLRAAAAGGAEVREGFPVREVVRDDDGRVTGIRGGPGSGSVTQGRLVIGADGLHSLVARSVAAPTYADTPSLTCAYYAYWSGLPSDGVEIYSRPGASWALIPTNDGLTCLVLNVKRERFPEIRRDIEGTVLATIADFAPTQRERLASAHRETRFVGTADLPNFYRRPYGPGWALVGDAGYHKDPCTAQGISDAFRDATLLAAAVDGSSGPAELTTALAAYEAARNETSRPLYDFTRRLAALDAPPPHMQQLFSALHANSDQTNRFFGVIAGTVPAAGFLARENLDRIIATA